MLNLLKKLFGMRILLDRSFNKINLVIKIYNEGTLKNRNKIINFLSGVTKHVIIYNNHYHKTPKNPPNKYHIHNS